MNVDSLTVQDLERRPRDELRLAVIGDPINHSLSPVMQNAGLEFFKLPYRYGRLQVPSKNLSAAFDAMRQKDFIGWNVTLPHKLDTFRMMDGLDPLAKRLGAVNTVVNQSGRLFGFNTDGKGLVAAVEESFGEPINQFRIALLGAGGGAGQGVARYLAGLGIPALHLINRTVTKLDPLAEELGGLATLKIGSWDDKLPKTLEEVDLIVNASSGGLKAEEIGSLNLNAISSRHRVFDMAYSTEETALVRHARTRGAQAVDGLSMLLYQGMFAFEIWFGKPAPGAAMKKALYAAAGRV